MHCQQLIKCIERVRAELPGGFAIVYSLADYSQNRNPLRFRAAISLVSSSTLIART
jgi:hypothetical protein